MTTIREAVEATLIKWADQLWDEEATSIGDVPVMVDELMEAIGPLMGEAQQKLFDSLESARDRARTAEDEAAEARALLQTITSRYRIAVRILANTLGEDAVWGATDHEVRDDVGTQRQLDAEA